MRTTVTLDDDVIAKLRSAIRKRGVSFKEALNSAVRTGLTTANPPLRPYQITPFSTEIRPGIDLTKSKPATGRPGGRGDPSEAEIGK